MINLEKIKSPLLKKGRGASELCSLDDSLCKNDVQVCSSGHLSEITVD